MITISHRAFPVLALALCAGTAPMAMAQTAATSGGVRASAGGTRATAGGTPAVVGQTRGPTTPRNTVLPFRPTQNAFFDPRGAQFPAFGGIGQVRPGIDMLSNPARQQVFATPDVPTQTIAGVPGVVPGAGGFEERHRFFPPVFVPDERFVTSDGVVVDGRFINRHLGVAFNVGAPVYYNLPPAVSYDPYYGGYTYGYGNPYAYAPIVYGPNGAYPSYAQPAPESMTPMTPAAPAQAAPAAPQAQPTPPSTMDIAKLDFRAGDYTSAASLLRNYLKAHPDDPEATRLLAIALIANKDLDSATAILRQAYRTDPHLAAEPINAYELGLDSDQLRRLVTSTVTYAHRAESASSWLTVTALMQAEGRNNVARTMLQNAEKQGLESEIVAQMRAALSR